MICKNTVFMTITLVITAATFLLCLAVYDVKVFDNWLNKGITRDHLRAHIRQLLNLDCMTVKQWEFIWVCVCTVVMYYNRSQRFDAILH